MDFARTIIFWKYFLSSEEYLWHSQREEEDWFGGLRTTFLLFADDVALLTLPSHDCQLSLERFAASVKQWGWELLPPNLRLWFLVRKRCDVLSGFEVRFCLKWTCWNIWWGSDWQVDQCGICSNAEAVPVCCGDESWTTMQGSPFWLLVDSCSYFQPWSQTVESGWKNKLVAEMSFIHRVTRLSLRETVKICHSGGTWSRVAAPPHWEEPIEVVWTFG